MSNSPLNHSHRSPALRRKQFTLRAAIGLMTLVCVGLGSIGQSIVRIRSQKATIQWLESQDAELSFATDADTDTRERIARYLFGSQRRLRSIQLNVEKFQDSDWDRLSTLTMVEDLLLESQSPQQLPRQAINSVRRLSQLRYLALVNFSLADSDTSAFNNMPLSLELVVPNSKNFMSISQLRELRELAKLEFLASDRTLNEQAPFTEADIVELQQQNEGLTIEFDSRSKQSVRPNKNGLAHLNRFYVGSDCTDATMRWLSNAKQLTTLEVVSPHITSDGLKHIGAFSHLSSLAIKTPALDDKCVIKLLAHGDLHLKSLDLGGQFGDECLEGIARQRELEWLRLASPQITERGIGFIARLSQLDSLFLTDAKLEGSAFDEFAETNQLREISLNEVTLSSSSARSMSRLKRLELLDLTNVRINSTAWQALTDVAGFTGLNVADTSIDRATFELLWRMSSLRRLSIDAPNITDDVVAPIDEWTSIESIQFIGKIDRTRLEAFARSHPTVRFRIGTEIVE